MERKSAWSLLMSEQQIVNEYKEAKSPRNQIAILADQNMCDKKTIVNILEAAGCEVPGYYKKKTKDPEATAEVFDEIAEETQKLQQEPKDDELKIKAAAYDAIMDLYPAPVDDGTCIDFTLAIDGIKAFVSRLIREA